MDYVQYRVICAEEEDFSDAVNDAIRAGWHLVGGVSVTTRVNSVEDGRELVSFIYAQAMLNCKPE